MYPWTGSGLSPFIPEGSVAEGDDDGDGGGAEDAVYYGEDHGLFIGVADEHGEGGVLAGGGGGGDGGVRIGPAGGDADEEERQDLPHEAREEGDASQLGAGELGDGHAGEAVPAEAAGDGEGFIQWPVHEEGAEHAPQQGAGDDARGNDEDLHVVVADDGEEAPALAHAEAHGGHEEIEQRFGMVGEGREEPGGLGVRAAGDAAEEGTEGEEDHGVLRFWRGAAGVIRRRFRPSAVYEAHRKRVDRGGGADGGDEAEEEALAADAAQLGEEAVPRAEADAHGEDEQERGAELEFFIGFFAGCGDEASDEDAQQHDGDGEHRHLRMAVIKKHPKTKRSGSARGWGQRARRRLSDVNF